MVLEEKPDRVSRHTPPGTTINETIKEIFLLGGSLVAGTLCLFYARFSIKASMLWT